MTRLHRLGVASAIVDSEIIETIYPLSGRPRLDGQAGQARGEAIARELRGPY